MRENNATQTQRERYHILKTDPDVFQAVLSGAKTFEIRLNDRGYAVGDVLGLRETKHTGAEMRAGAPLEYTGRECQRFVSHVLTGYGLADGWCCLSFRLPHAAGESVPVASAEIMDALNWVDDFIARCNRDDRGSCESVNVLRRALASAPVAGEAVYTLRVRGAIQAWTPTAAAFSIPDGEHQLFLSPAAPQASAEDEWKAAIHKFMDTAIPALAAIANVHTSDDIDALDAMPREPVIDQVRRLSHACEELSRQVRPERPREDKYGGRQRAGEVLFWYRPRSDGWYEGPIHNDRIEEARKVSGVWVPLVAAPQASALNAEYTRGRADGFDAGHGAALEKAAAALEDHRKAGREWVPGSLWDTLSREAAARIRALKQPQADKGGSQQRAAEASAPDTAKDRVDKILRERMAPISEALGLDVMLASVCKDGFQIITFEFETLVYSIGSDGAAILRVSFNCSHAPDTLTADQVQIISQAAAEVRPVGGEVLAWLDQHRGVTSRPATAMSSLELYRQWRAAEQAQAAAPCTCPSGEGSLRHPCAAHPAKASGNGGEEWSDS